NRIVLAQHIGPRCRKSGCMQRLQNREFPVDRVRRRKQCAGRLAPKDEALSIRCGDAVGRVRLPPFELCNLERAFQAADVLPQIRFQRTRVETKPLVDGLGADEFFEHQADIAIFAARSAPVTIAMLTRYATAYNACVSLRLAAVRVYD